MKIQASYRAQCGHIIREEFDAMDEKDLQRMMNKKMKNLCEECVAKITGLILAANDPGREANC